MGVRKGPARMGGLARAAPDIAICDAMPESVSESEDSSFKTLKESTTDSRASHFATRGAAGSEDGGGDPARPAGEGSSMLSCAVQDSA